MRKVVLTYGLIAGAIMSAIMFGTIPFEDSFGSSALIVGYTSMVMAFLMVYFGVRSYRDNVAGGVVTFGQAFAVASLIAAIGIVCYVVSWEIISHTLTPDFAERYAARAIERARAAGKSPAEIAALTKEMADFAASYKNPLVNVAYTTLEPLPVGLLFAIGSSWALSRKRRVGAAVA